MTFAERAFNSLFVRFSSEGRSRLARATAAFNSLFVRFLRRNKNFQISKKASFQFSLREILAIYQSPKTFIYTAFNSLFVRFLCVTTLLERATRRPFNSLFVRFLVLVMFIVIALIKELTFNSLFVRFLLR